MFVGMRDIYQPHYSYFLDSSFKATPFNIILNSLRPLYCGSSCKCIESSLSRKNYERIKQLSINKISHPSWTNLTSEKLKINKKSFYENMVKGTPDENTKRDMSEELDQYFSSLFQETSMSNNWKMANYFHGMFQNGILYHLGQLKMVFQRSGFKIFITKSTDNIWIDNYFMSFILRSLTSSTVVKIHEENHKILHDFQYGSHLIITPKNRHLLKTTISCLMASDCCLIIEDSPGKDAFLTSLIGGLLNEDFEDIHLIPVSFSFDYLPKDQSPQMECLKNFVWGYKNFGSVRIDFDKLLDLKSFIDHLFLTNGLNREKFPRSVLSLEVSNHTYVSSYRNQRIMAVPFVAFILAFSGKKTVGIEEAIDDMEYFCSLFERCGIELGFSGHLKNVYKYVVEFLLTRKVLIRLKNNLISIETDLRPYFLKELYPAIWTDILLYNSAGSMLNIKDINYFHGTFYEHKHFSRSLMVKRAIWLDSLIEVRLLKPCEDLESVLYTSLDQLINEGSFRRVNVPEGFKYRRIDGLVDDSRQRIEELKISTLARIAKTLSFYKGLVGDFLKHLYDLTHCLIKKVPIEEWMSQSSISDEDKDRCISSFVRLGILEENEEVMKISQSWHNNSKLEKFRSSIYMYIK